MLQALPVLQVGIVAFRDPIGAVEETPPAGGNHSGAVAVAWAGRKADDEDNSTSNPVMKQKSMMFLWLIGTYFNQSLYKKWIKYIKGVSCNDGRGITNCDDPLS